MTDKDDKWTRFSLTSPPANGDHHANWVAEVLWIILDKVDGLAERVTDAEGFQLNCPAIKKMQSLMAWCKISLAALTISATLAGFVFLVLRIAQGQG